MERLTEREGVAGIALLAMFADGVVMAEEDEVLRDRLSRYPLFEGVGEADMGRMLERLEEMSRADGEGLLRAACAAAAPRLGATAFVIAAEVIAADGDVAPEESEFLARVRPLLHVPEGVAARVLEVVRLRSAT